MLLKQCIRKEHLQCCRNIALNKKERQGSYILYLSLSRDKSVEWDLSISRDVVT